jgi:hypothetical protein
MNMHGDHLRLDHQPVATSEAGLSPLWAEAKAEHASSCATTLRQGSFAPPALPSFVATMNPSDSQPSLIAVIYSRGQFGVPISHRFAAGLGLSGSWLICRYPPSALTPEDPTAASARCFAVDAGFAPSGGLAIPSCFTRPKPVHFRYGWHLCLPRLRTTDYSVARTVGYTSNEQFTCSVPFN